MRFPVLLALAFALPLTGCLSDPSVSYKIRDPRQVVLVLESSDLVQVVPAVDDTAAPGDKPDTMIAQETLAQQGPGDVVARRRGDRIEVSRRDGDPDSTRLALGDGYIGPFPGGAIRRDHPGDAWLYVKLDYFVLRPTNVLPAYFKGTTAPRLHGVDYDPPTFGEGPTSTRTRLNFGVATPKDNVEYVEERVTPRRDVAWTMIAGGVALGVFGAVYVTDKVYFLRYGAYSAFTLGVTLDVVGIWELVRSPPPPRRYPLSR